MTGLGQDMREARERLRRSVELVTERLVAKDGGILGPGRPLEDVST